MVIFFIIFLSLPRGLREPVAWVNHEIGIVVGWAVGSIAHLVASPFGWGDGTSQLFALLRWYGGSSSITASAADTSFLGTARHLVANTANLTIDPIGRTVIDVAVAFYITLPLASWAIWRWVYLPLKSLRPEKPPSQVKRWWLWFAYGKPMQHHLNSS